MEEKTFFEYEDVKVTNTRFVSGEQTFAMNNVTSVKTHVERPSRLLGILILILSVGVTYNNPEVGLVMMAAAAYYLYRQKTTYHLLLTTSAGETNALRTHQLEYMTQVVGALNQAIIYRG
ncbi:DUF6232 family protein [Thiobacillus denitrificans]|uniref:DUF6232 family protein n=1 Tax=Thiobacillus denitrificans TaxID=36861 RepID=UPI000370534D|nr:DUF6232 family protein [Thiobacillus denitrificans]